MNKKLSVALGIVVGVIFLVITFIYWTTASGSLPSYFPGYAMGGATIHIKHGIAALVVSVAGFIYAWFASGSKKASR